MKLMIQEIKLRAAGWAIALCSAALWGALVFAVIGLVDPQLRQRGSALDGFFIGLVGGGGLSLVVFTIFHSPLRAVVRWLVEEVPLLGLLLLPLVLCYYCCVWPGMFIAERMGLIERIA